MLIVKPCSTVKVIQVLHLVVWLQELFFFFFLEEGLDDGLTVPVTCNQRIPTNTYSDVQEEDQLWG